MNKINLDAVVGKEWRENNTLINENLADFQKFIKNRTKKIKLVNVGFDSGDLISKDAIKVRSVTYTEYAITIEFKKVFTFFIRYADITNVTVTTFPNFTSVIIFLNSSDKKTTISLMYKEKH